MKYSDLRANDPVIQAIILRIVQANIQRIDVEAIAKILYEGADGRYLQEVKEDD
jgi:hypothetical protein